LDGSLDSVIDVIKQGQEDKKTLERYGKTFKDSLEEGAAEKLVEQASQAKKLNDLAMQAIRVAKKLIQNLATPEKTAALEKELEELRMKATGAVEPVNQPPELLVTYDIIPPGTDGSMSASDRRVANSR
jgi:hypothetical protein